MGRSSRLLPILIALCAAGLPAPAAHGETAEALFPAVANALETGDRGRLAGLFPSDRKVMVSLHRIADLQGFAGSGPLVEALRRYLAKKDEVRFEREGEVEDERGHANRDKSEGPLRVRGVLVSKDKAGGRERITLVFVFERMGEAWRAVEVRETG